MFENLSKFDIFFLLTFFFFILRNVWAPSISHQTRK